MKGRLGPGPVPSDAGRAAAGAFDQVGSLGSREAPETPSASPSKPTSATSDMGCSAADAGFEPAEQQITRTPFRKFDTDR